MKKSEVDYEGYAALCREADSIEPGMFDEYGVLRGLREDMTV